MNNIHKLTVGKAEVIVLQDTWMAMPPNAFFPDLPESAWQPYRDLIDGEGNLHFSINTFLIRSGGKTILVDTGFGAWPSDFPVQEPSHLPAVMEQAGVKPDAIDTVVFTHLHLDHTGWNTIDRAGKPTPMFPKARYIVQRKEWEYWGSTEETRSFARHADTLQPIADAGLLDLVEGEHAVTSEITTVPTPGHTPGHIAFAIVSGGERLYLIGDAAHSSAQVTQPEWSISFDVDGAQAARSRRTLFDRIEREGAAFIANHFPFPSAGRIAQAGGKRVFRPIT